MHVRVSIAGCNTLPFANSSVSISISQYLLQTFLYIRDISYKYLGYICSYLYTTEACMFFRRQNTIMSKLYLLQTDWWVMGLVRGIKLSWSRLSWWPSFESFVPIINFSNMLIIEGYIVLFFQSVFLKILVLFLFIHCSHTQLLIILVIIFSQFNAPQCHNFSTVKSNLCCTKKSRVNIDFHPFLSDTCSA